MAEAFDVADRGRFYDRTGAIRDVVQNHMLQVLATVLADPPDGSGLDDSWLDAKARVVAALRPLTTADVVRGQYEGYRDVDGVDPDSTTESYVAVRLALDSWRWAGVPIVIRAGKTMPVTATEVSVRFRPVPFDVFGARRPPGSANSLRFRIWPETQIGLTLAGKKPGAGREAEAQDLVFAEHSGSDMRPYDRLIGAALDGQPDAVRPAGHGRGRLAGRRPRARRRRPRAPLPPRQLGTQGGRRPAARRRRLARPGRLRLSTDRAPPPQTPFAACRCSRSRAVHDSEFCPVARRPRPISTAPTNTLTTRPRTSRSRSICAMTTTRAA